MAVLDTPPDGLLHSKVEAAKNNVIQRSQLSGGFNFFGFCDEGALTPATSDSGLHFRSPASGNSRARNVVAANCTETIFGFALTFKRLFGIHR